VIICLAVLCPTALKWQFPPCVVAVATFEIASPLKQGKAVRAVKIFTIAETCHWSRQTPSWQKAVERLQTVIMWLQAEERETSRRVS